MQRSTFAADGEFTMREALRIYQNASFWPRASKWSNAKYRFFCLGFLQNEDRIFCRLGKVSVLFQD